LTYDERLSLVESFLASKHAIVLATSQDGRVTARTVSFAYRGVEIYFMSFAGNTKCRQIRTNPRVALCRDSIQIEGAAEILGPVSSVENEELARMVLAKYPEDFRRHASDPRMVLIRVRPSQVRIFHEESGEYLVDCLDLESRTVTVEHISNTALA